MIFLYSVIFLSLFFLLLHLVLYEMKWYESILVQLMAVMAMLLSWVNVAHSSPNDSVKVLPDSSNFVTASLVIISPTDDVYSSLGHCAVRMECPSHNLDFCFSSETETGSFNDFINFLMERQVQLCLL